MLKIHIISLLTLSCMSFPLLTKNEVNLKATLEQRKSPRLVEKAQKNANTLKTIIQPRRSLRLKMKKLLQAREELAALKASMNPKQLELFNVAQEYPEIAERIVTLAASQDKLIYKQSK